MTFGCLLGRDVGGDLELLHEGFRSVSAHGKLVEDGGRYELFSPFIPSHLSAQVYGSEIVKMLKEGHCGCLGWHLLVWTEKSITHV